MLHQGIGGGRFAEKREGVGSTPGRATEGCWIGMFTEERNGLKIMGKMNWYDPLEGLCFASA